MSEQKIRRLRSKINLAKLDNGVLLRQLNIDDSNNTVSDIVDNVDQNEEAKLVNVIKQEADDDLSRVEFRIKPSASRGVNNYHPLDEELLSPPVDDLASRFEEYGTTPPRTRMKIKSRDWERKKAHAVASVGAYVVSAKNTLLMHSYLCIVSTF
uniref:Uncharacterized protein n=1 Tax=Bactrocera latifrons TaxID=174628 RepID=A0A0K8WE53_BACLA